jgi:aspartate racemase
MTRRYYEQFRDHEYPEIIIYSVNFQKYINWAYQGQWYDVITDLTNVLIRLHTAGADFALIACNTVHVVFDQIQQQSPIPLLSIIDATAESIQSQKIQKVGLLGTQFTMEHPFYRQRLAKYGISAITPDQTHREYLDTLILNELSQGILNPITRRKVLVIIDSLIEQGAAGIVLGCTEIPLLISHHESVSLFDTASIHAEKALQYALQQSI